MIKLNKKQSDALEMVKKNRLSILTGGPGTGKTTISKAIVDYMKSEGHKILLAAPTGKSAQVMALACNHKASTIHKLLHPIPTKINGKLYFEFSYNADNPLDCTFIIIDEFSMVSNDLAASLFQAIDPEKTKVLVVGDNNQLPSVQPGCVLYDLISCEAIPITRLINIFRNSGEVVKFCKAIRTDTPYDLPKTLNPENGGHNYVHVECSNPQAIHDTIVKLATENMPRRGYDTVNDVQILSPTNSRGMLSCDAFNESIQEIVNQQPDEKCINNSGFRLNSKVINTKNLYDAVSVENEKEIILNGDMGMITDVQEIGKNMIVRFQNPTRNIILSKYGHYLKLAYCLTIHRSQGSQFPVVILPVHTSFAYQSNRALLYTAASRAQEILITVGQKVAIKQSIENVNVYNRKTFLSEKIEDRMLCQL